MAEAKKKRTVRRISTVARLDPRIKEEVDRLIREGTHTTDEILAHLRGLGGDVSRSAIGRYAKNARSQMERYQQMQQLAKVWIGKLRDEPEGDIARLLSENIKVMAMQASNSLSGEDDGATPKELQALSATLRNVGYFDKTSVETTIKMRERIAKEERERAAELVTKAAKKGGLTAAGVDSIRREILGIET
jgi:F0F1-type ATP synthase alpha subunit